MLRVLRVLRVMRVFFALCTCYACWCNETTRAARIVPGRALPDISVPSVGNGICSHVGEEHLILSAILAANLPAVHRGSVPAGCEEMCGTAPEAETKRQNKRHLRGRHQKAQHPHSTKLNNHIHVCRLIWTKMNALCFSPAAFPQLPKWPPLARHCLWLSDLMGTRGCVRLGP